MFCLQVATHHVEVAVLSILLAHILSSRTSAMSTEGCAREDSPSAHRRSATFFLLERGGEGGVGSGLGEGKGRVSNSSARGRRRKKQESSKCPVPTSYFFSHHALLHHGRRRRRRPPRHAARARGQRAGLHRLWGRRRGGLRDGSFAVGF